VIGIVGDALQYARMSFSLVSYAPRSYSPGSYAAGSFPSGAATALGRPASADDPLGPLGPVDQQPDVARDLACDLTAADRLCSPPEPEPRDPDDFDFDPPGEIGAGAGFGGVGTLLVIVLVIALMVAVGWVVLSIVRNRTPIDDTDADDLDEDLEDVAEERIVDEDRPPDRWRRAAGEHRAAGRFREAVRCEYRALVGDLARAGHVDEIPGRTSGEERAQVRALAPGVAPSFDVAADIFDAAWFDDAAVTRDRDERFVAAATLVLDDVLAGAALKRARR